MTEYRPTSFREPPSARLAEFMRQGWAVVPGTLGPPPSPPPELTAARRAALSDRLPGDRLVIPAGQPPVRAGDQHYPFRPDSNYAWLAGDQSAGGVLVLEPYGGGHEATLYLVPPSGRDNDEFWLNGATGELWIGPRPPLAELSGLLGIGCRPRAGLEQALERQLPAGSRTLLLRGPDPGADEAVPATDPGAETMLRAVLAELRLVKDEWEIGQLREAVRLTANGFAAVARVLREAGPRSSGRSPRTEADVAAAFTHAAHVSGGGLGYQPIAAGGWHGAILHWTRNDAPLPPGELIVLDAGAETRTLYTADVTRTYPVSGTFTAAQRDVYDIVLAAQQEALGVIRPGQPFRGYHRAVAAALAAGLEKLGVLPVPAAESLREDSGLHRRWTLCAPGHMLGLDVHDCGDAPASSYIDGVFAAGQVLTVEPGLYFQRDDSLVPAALRGLGVRIEDDVLVTEDGCEVLSAGLPREPAAVEEWLARA
ncbi:MAG: aminopeptidase P family protein [Actinobacteria bacterium]|nr:aminopeptidase P family protein [Actinomycetota bacterium]MBO0788563.1 aminopeptidase P family protein [Actinomycetota bacterium]MBO0814430.1 aminopeptidase P family protein [Actinomycetota bacterium]